jgi:hypothetical protein
MSKVGTVPRVLDRESADLPLTVDVQLGVFVEILGLGYAPGFELDV